MTTDEKWNAVISNDPSYDGRFFYGVRSTGIFCRPSCVSRVPNRENVVFFDCREDAERAGFRPCKRCRPDLASFDPAAELADRAKTVIDRSFAERTELQEKLNALGVTRRHLTEVFEKKYDLTPEEYTAQVRLRRAKELLERGHRVTEVSFSVGMESPSAFSAFFKKHEGISPSDYAAQKAMEHPYFFCETPLGLMRMVEDRAGIVSLKFVDGVSGPIRTEPAGVYSEEAKRQLLEYFSGRRRTFDVPLSIQGSDFQKNVWSMLQRIPYGETRTYQQIAQMAGNPKAARAVGMANNRNPIHVLIPCHRVIGKNGSLVGYAGGLERKKRLLELEKEAEGRSILR